MKSMNKEELKKRTIGKNTNAYMYVLDELKVLQRLEHPNVVYLHEVINDPNSDHLFLISEYHSRGSLADMLHKKNEQFKFYN